MAIVKLQEHKINVGKGYTRNQITIPREIMLQTFWLKNQLLKLDYDEKTDTVTIKPI